eukprot:CAMPEP_0179099178 /NCGR_PEP_ID=MMETSP0796-20121207/45744_1 /TAXON_ID=73915 /ORGANISM="Pyrodinium bahamense, Strain pbaha01" /LENGTH=292 /DNA_ID=CAMNT_0020796977 /DNA_START=1 /DNA_END=880 /DNA_ORIENTATION=+
MCAGGSQDGNSGHRGGTGACGPRSVDEAEEVEAEATANSMRGAQSGGGLQVAPTRERRWAEAAPDDDSSGSPGRFSRIGDSPGKGEVKATNNADESDSDVGGLCLAACSACGATHCVDFDVVLLGIDFRCGHAGAECAGGLAAEVPTSCPDRTLDERPNEQPLSAEEQKRLFERFSLQTHGGEARGDLARSVHRLTAGPPMPKVRYLNSEVVTHKGEKFIKQECNPPSSSGCPIGGVIGARKQGRLGLGLKRRPKEEVDKICISNKERGHTKKGSGHREIFVFDSKWEQRSR